MLVLRSVIVAVTVRLGFRVVVAMLVGEPAGVAVSLGVTTGGVAVIIPFSMIAVGPQFVRAVPLAGAEEDESGGGGDDGESAEKGAHRREPTRRL